MTPMDELSARNVLASMERSFELADKAMLTARMWEERATAWERRDDLARTIRGHCAAYGLIPTVDVGPLKEDR
jgi:hypothetical protein